MGMGRVRRRPQAMVADPQAHFLSLGRNRDRSGFSLRASSFRFPLPNTRLMACKNAYAHTQVPPATPAAPRHGDFACIVPLLSERFAASLTPTLT